MYDSREKAILDYESNLLDARAEGLRIGRQEGRQEGERIGMEIGRIQLLQELLGTTISPLANLEKSNLTELTTLRESLQNQLRDRTV
jgi:predicted transposase YdaD